MFPRIPLRHLSVTGECTSAPTELRPKDVALDARDAEVRRRNAELVDVARLDVQQSDTVSADAAAQPSTDVDRYLGARSRPMRRL